jgi:FAD/FMN-containing dehydrogenase
MEYVHGAGIRLAHLMEREQGAGLAVLARLKTALDPDGVLNPGKLGLPLPPTGYPAHPPDVPRI